MRQYSDAALFMDGSGGFGQRHQHGNRLPDPQRQDMPLSAGNFDTRHNVKGILCAPFAGPQTRVQGVMIGDGDDIQMAQPGNMVQNLLHGGKAIAGGGVHVEICLTHNLPVCSITLVSIRKIVFLILTPTRCARFPSPCMEREGRTEGSEGVRMNLRTGS